MKLQEVYDSYSENIIPSYTKVPIIFVKGKGSYLWDMQGKKYLDFFPGWGVGALGHCHPAVMNAVRDQISKLIFVPNNYYNLPQARLGRELAFCTKGEYKAFLCNSGAEANEAAIKLCRKAGGGRYEIISFRNSFHGRTLAALAATGQTKYQDGFAPMPDGFVAVPFNDINEVKRAISPRTAGIMIELVQGEGGINVAAQEFVLELRRICDEKKLLLIADEVQTGMGRTGTMFAWQSYGVAPDCFTLAKAVAGGLPMGVMMARRSVSDLLSPGTHASTFGGGPVICKAALAVFTALHKEKLLNNAKAMGEYLAKALEGLKKNHVSVREVRGMGLMRGVELSVPGKPVVEECIKRGLLINCTHENVLRVMPALNTKKKEIDKAVGVIDRSLTALKL